MISAPDGVETFDNYGGEMFGARVVVHGTSAARIRYISGGGFFCEGLRAPVGVVWLQLPPHQSFPHSKTPHLFGLWVGLNPSFFLCAVLTLPCPRLPLICNHSNAGVTCSHVYALLTSHSALLTQPCLRLPLIYTQSCVDDVRWSGWSLPLGPLH